MSFSTTFPNARLAGFTLSCAEPLDVSWSEKLAETPFAEPEMTAVCVELTDDAATLNVALLAPAATVTEEGTTAAGLLLARLIVKACGHAVPFKVAVHASDDAPVNVELAQEMELKAAMPAALILMARLPADELLAIVTMPVKLLTCEEVNPKFSAAVWPGFSVIGVVTPVAENNDPATEMLEMVTGALPVELSVIACDAFWPTLIFPKFTVVELAARVGVAAFSCRVKVCDAAPPVPVKVAV